MFICWWQLEDLRNSERANEQELDLLKFQVEEIENADLKPDEEEDIEKRYQRISNSSKLVEQAGKITGLLEHTVNEALAEVQRAARELETLDPSVTDMLGGLDQAVLELQDLEREVGAYSSELEMNPEEEIALSERINTFETLKRKYGSTLADVMTHGEAASQRLFEIENRDGVLEELQVEVDALAKKVQASGKKLTTVRKKSAPKLAKVIATHLQELGFKQAAFEVDLVSNSQPTLGGLESVDFQFGPNPGEPLKPLRQIASSGEISRVMLAVKSALAKQDSIPLLVFDEIDANVGGEIIWRGAPQAMLIGPSNETWDIAFIARYPDLNAFLAMIMDPAYQAIVFHRQAAVETSRLIAHHEQNSSTTFG
mgnify:CR=1 FL=1